MLLCDSESCWYSVRSQDLYLLSARTAFMHSAPSSFKVLQKDLNLIELVSLAVFKSLLVVTSSSVCRCFNLAIFYLDYLLMICCD